MSVEYGVMHPDGRVTVVGRAGQARIEEDTEAIAMAMGGAAVSRAASWSAWTELPSPCPRCELPIWPHGLGALHADGSIDCLIREGVPANHEAV